MWSSINDVSRLGRYMSLPNRMLAMDTVLSIVSADKQWALAGMLARGFARVRALQPELAQKLRELEETARAEGVDDLPAALLELEAAEGAGEEELSWGARYLLADQRVRAMGEDGADALSLSTLLPPHMAVALITASKDPKKRAKALAERTIARSHVPELRGLNAVWDEASPAYKAAALEVRDWHVRIEQGRVEECLVRIKLIERHKALDKNTTNAAARIAKARR